jgi:peptidoglycan hydrolase-like protein with peptidoglycan-binding domain
MTNPLGDLISRGEGGYNSYNRGTQHGHIVPANQHFDFSQMTLDELARRQGLPISDPDKVFAVGKYQIIPPTMRGAVEKLHLDTNERYTPEIQERIFADYLIRDKRPDIYSYIIGQTSASLHGAQKAASQEWASIDDPDTLGKPYGEYAKHGNHSSIRAAHVANALNQMREQYQKDINQGLSPAEAWKSVTGQAHSANVLAPPSQVKNPKQAHPSNLSTHPQPVHSPLATKPVDKTKDLQQQLNHLGYRDSHGHPLTIDGTTGPNTEHAIRSFQHAHRLHVDGVAGKDTLAALVDAHHSPLLSEATHPAHPLYTQVLQGVQKLPHGTFKSEDEQRNLTVALTIAAHVGGLKKIDHVVLGTNGVNVFAVQGRLDDPAHLRTHVDRVQSMTHTVDHNSLALQQVVYAHAVHSHAPIEQNGAAMGISR